jgi:hypothetical protein
MVLAGSHRTFMCDEWLARGVNSWGAKALPASDAFVVRRQQVGLIERREMSRIGYQPDEQSA